eukprot:364991-Chlamydomonas_euryale.AAC.9
MILYTDVPCVSDVVIGRRLRERSRELVSPGAAAARPTQITNKKAPELRTCLQAVRQPLRRCKPQSSGRSLDPPRA